MRKAFVYGFKTWGGIVAITFVVGLITNVICGFLSVPYMLTAMAKAFLVIENSDGFSFVNSTWFSLISYLSALLYIYVCYVGYSALLIAIAISTDMHAALSTSTTLTTKIKTSTTSIKTPPTKTIFKQ